MSGDPTPERRSAAPHHVVLGVATSGPGGAEHMVLMLASALRAAGQRVTLLTLRPGWMTERAERDGLPVWILPQKPGIDLGWVRRLAARLRQERVTVFHGHEYEMNVYGGLAAAWAAIPSVATVHGAVWGVDDLRHQLAYACVDLVSRQQLVAVSEELATRLARGLHRRRDRLELVPNGIPVPEAPPAHHAEARRAARLEAGLPPALAADTPLVLAVGNLYPVKDHASLVRALAQMRTPAHVAIAGRGDEEPRLRALAEELGMQDRVHLLGLRDDVSALLRAADVFAQPSLSEGLPLSILEAMAAGLPVVASDVGGIPEAIVSGECGLLVPPASPAALATALDRVLEDPTLADQLAGAAFERVRTRYSVETMARRYLALYDGLARRRAP